MALREGHAVSTHTVTDLASLAEALVALGARVNEHDALFVAIAATCREDADARRAFDAVLDKVARWRPENQVVAVLRETLARLDQPSTCQRH